MWKGMWGREHVERTEGKGMWKQGCGGNCVERDVGHGERTEGKGRWRELCGKGCGEEVMVRGLRGKGRGDKEVEGIVGEGRWGRGEY